MDACPVEDLLTAGGARGGYEGRCDAIGLVDGFANGGEKHHLAYGQRSLVVFLLVTKRSCHTAAATGDDVDFGVLYQLQGGDGLLGAYQGFLVAMAVEPNLNGISLEVVGSDTSSLHLTHDELIEKQGVAS